MIQTLDIIQFFLDKPEYKSCQSAFQGLKIFCLKNGTITGALIPREQSNYSSKIKYNNAT